MTLLTSLVSQGVLAEEEASAIDAQAKETKVSIEDVLIERGIPAATILGAKAREHSLPLRILEKDEKIPFDLLQRIPEESARYYHIVPLGEKEGVFEVGVLDPENMEAMDALNFIMRKVGMPYTTYLVSDADFDKIIEMYKGISGEVGAALDVLSGADDGLPGKPEAEAMEEDVHGTTVEALDKVAALATKTIEGGITLMKEDAPIQKIVATVLRYAIEGKASDVHIEPGVQKMKVRFRVDGQLHTSLELPMQVQRQVVARIKVLSQLKLDERRKPQDGRFSAKLADRKIDFRVSTFPTYYGEKVVMRILDRSTGTSTLDESGMSAEHMALVRKNILRPYGMILISGPTGSGKSTTLRSMLMEVNRDTANVVSLEDPVEYDIPGMSQSQVRPEIGYTFASGLRSILRQDPDIIMVGEIRDKETAQLAIQAALTGHLVFSTIHTNTAAGVIPRLIDMGVDPYLIAPTLSLIIAQRLVRKVCGPGRRVPLEGSTKLMMDRQFADLPLEYRSKIPFGDILAIEPTPECPSGIRGRLGVFEMFEMNTSIEGLILKNGNEQEVYNMARSQGMLTMKEDAIVKMFKGLVPFEEVNTLGGEILSINAEPTEAPADLTTPSEPVHGEGDMVQL